MKYQLVFNSNSKMLFKPCESCGSRSHILSDCPAFNHLLSKNRIQSKLNFSQNQNRYNYKRRFQRMNSLSHKQNVEKSHQTFVSNYNFDKTLQIDSLSKIMTDSSEMDMEQSQESPSMPKETKEIEMETSQKKTNKARNSAIQSPKLQNEMKTSKMKIHLENCKKENENPDGTYDHLPSSNLGEIKEVQSVLEVEQEENNKQQQPTHVSTTNLTHSKSGTLTRTEKKLQKMNLTIEENMELIHSFDKMKAFVKFMPESNYANVIQKVNRQMRIILKKKNGKKKSDKRRKNTKKSPESTGSLKKQSPSHRKFSIFKNEKKVLKSLNSRNSWKNN